MVKMVMTNRNYLGVVCCFSYALAQSRYCPELDWVWGQTETVWTNRNSCV
jgi:ammonia channel protein AmtB